MVDGSLARTDGGSSRGARTTGRSARARFAAGLVAGVTAQSCPVDASRLAALWILALDAALGQGGCMPTGAVGVANTDRRDAAAAAPRGKILYLTMDGLLEPLGRSQIVKFIERLAQRGWRYTIVSLEKK